MINKNKKTDFRSEILRQENEKLNNINEKNNFYTTNCFITTNFL